MRKQYILYIVILLSSINIIKTNNASALSYSSSVGVGFTFNPTLSVNISPSDLVILNLAPGTTNDSNTINVSVATNAAYGYTLSAIMNGDNNDLTHTNGTNTFSSIATDASLSILTTDNTWGYSYKLSNENVWNNYSGLSTETSKTLVDSNDQTVIPIDFKIGAKAASTQASGTYTGTINFVAVSNVAPMSLLDSFIASGAEQLNGYFRMQDMTHSICSNVDIEESELQLIDVRDNKVYWVAKLKDGNCWMTQNLDLDLSHEVALTSETSDIDPDSYGKTIYTAETGYSKDENTSVVSWLPERSTYTSTSAPGSTNWAGDTGDNSTSGYYHPYSWNRISNDGGPVYPDSIVTKAIAGSHAQSGNYYNWSAAVASNNSLNASGSQKNSICSKSWRLPINGEYNTLYNTYKTAENHGDAFGLMANPLWFIRSGYINSDGNLKDSNNGGGYWSDTFTNRLYFYSHAVYASNGSIRSYGFSLRCTAD